MKRNMLFILLPKLEEIQMSKGEKIYSSNTKLLQIILEQITNNRDKKKNSLYKISNNTKLL